MRVDYFYFHVCRALFRHKIIPQINRHVLFATYKHLVVTLDAVTTFIVIKKKEILF